MKKKMDFATKAKLLYAIELGVFAVIFLVIAALRFFSVIKYNETRAIIFNWVTIFGGTWIIVDLIWAIFDKKRQKRIALIDKIIHSPAGIYLVSFDLYCLISQTKEPAIYQYGIPIALAYLGLCYIFEAIYHFKYPVPGIIDAVEQEKTLSEQETLEDIKKDSSKEESEDIKNGEKS